MISTFSQSLPAELEWRIFEVAAKDDRLTMALLVRVAKRVQIWQVLFSRSFLPF